MIDPYEIDRFLPDVKIQIGSDTFHLTYDNTDIFQFGRGYGMFDHLHIKTPGEDSEELENNFVFNCDDLIKALIAHDFPRHYFPFPPEDVVDFYITNTLSTTDDEIERLGDGK